jgi:pSer/pThr/pTyr-binding forkhead associated (FHA) protein
MMEGGAAHVRDPWESLMIAKLLERSAEGGQRREIAVTKDEFLIGRGADCDLRLRVSAVSRHHCLLRSRGGDVTVTDLGSANGTFVNGQRLLSQTALRHGDEIAIGDFRFIVELEGPSGVDWTPSVSAAPDVPTARLSRPKVNAKDKPDSTANPP